MLWRKRPAEMRMRGSAVRISLLPDLFALYSQARRASLLLNGSHSATGPPHRHRRRARHQPSSSSSISSIDTHHIFLPFCADTPAAKREGERQRRSKQGTRLQPAHMQASYASFLSTLHLVRPPRPSLITREHLFSHLASPPRTQQQHRRRRQLSSQ